MHRCAILGGEPVREKEIPWISTMDEKELQSVIDVMKSGVLSSFLADAGDQFLGGQRVKELEKNFCRRFNSKYAISVNSATTALQTAIAACNIGPGDEVIVTPYTMVATASSILINGAIPIFADIDDQTYCLNPDSIEEMINSRTKAILTVNIFGLPSNLPAIQKIAKKHGLYLIEDNSQAPGATVYGRCTGTFGDIGVFSLNYHKIIHSGEGGVLITDNPELARRCQLIRNHGEYALDQLGDKDTIVLGSNIRMSELHAAIGVEQLKKLDGFLEERRELADIINKEVDKREGLIGVYVPKGYTHSYYVYPLRYESEVWGITRAEFAQSMKAEGFTLGEGYVKPLYLLNIYEHKHVFNNTTFPFSYYDAPSQDYIRGLCPVAERMYYNELLTADICRIPYTEKEIYEFFEAIDKIWKERGDIQEKFRLTRRDNETV